MKWTTEEPTAPGWYWLTDKSYVGNERFAYDGALRTIYVEIRQDIANSEVGEPYPVYYGLIGKGGKPQRKIEEVGIEPMFSGPIAVPEMPIA